MRLCNLEVVRQELKIPRICLIFVENNLLPFTPIGEKYCVETCCEILKTVKETRQQVQANFVNDIIQLNF